MRFSIGPDRIPENLVEDWPHALLKSVDEGANWFLVSVVRGAVRSRTAEITFGSGGRLEERNVKAGKQLHVIVSFDMESDK